MSLQTYGSQDELDHCRERERVEREAALNTAEASARESHREMADRYADEAWSIAERYDLPYEKSGLWP